MRFKVKPGPILGSKKTKIRFLLFPLWIGDEIRWWEFAKIKYERQSVTVSYDMGGVVQEKWVAVEFLPYDPVKDCEIYITKGCVHVDGMICDIEACAEIEKKKEVEILSGTLHVDIINNSTTITNVTESKNQGFVPIK